MATPDQPDQVPPGVFEALHQIGVAIGAVLEPIGLARLVAEHARALLTADSVGLWISDEHGGALKALHLANWTHAVPLAKASTDNSAVVAVPLLVDGHAIGVLGVGFPEPQQATPAAVRTLTLLAAEVGPALEAARLYEAMRTELAERGRAEDSLRFQGQLLDAVEHALIALNFDGTIRYWNRAAEAMYGWRSDEVLGRRARELLVPEGLSAKGDEIRAKLAAGETWTGEFPLRRRDGSIFPALVSDSPVRDADGRPIGLIGASIDLSERVESSRRLEESEQRFRAVWEHAADALVLSGLDGIIQLVNPACTALYGRRADELIGQDLTLIFPDIQQPGDLFAAAEPPPLFQNVVRRADGGESTVECRAEFVSQGGARVGLITIIRDISDRVRRADLDVRFASLTPRELDVLRQIAAGKTNPEIGRVLGLSSKAARNRVAHVLAKLGVPDRTQAAVLAVELGLAPPSA